MILPWSWCGLPYPYISFKVTREWAFKTKCSLSFWREKYFLSLVNPHSQSMTQEMVKTHQTNLYQLLGQGIWVQSVINEPLLSIIHHCILSLILRKRKHFTGEQVSFLYTLYCCIIMRCLSSLRRWVRRWDLAFLLETQACLSESMLLNLLSWVSLDMWFREKENNKTAQE